MTMIRHIATGQFYFAVVLSILCGFLVLGDPDLMLPSEDSLFGPLRNNLLIAVGYLLVGQIGLLLVRYLKGGHFEALVMGYSFAATAFGSRIYAEINGLPISPTFTLMLGYFAVAHGIYYVLGKPDPLDRNANPTRS